MTSYLRNKSDREIEELIEATTEERVVEGFADKKKGMIVLFIILGVFALIGAIAFIPFDKIMPA